MMMDNAEKYIVEHAAAGSSDTTAVYCHLPLIHHPSAPRGISIAISISRRLFANASFISSFRSSAAVSHFAICCSNRS